MPGQQLRIPALPPSALGRLTIIRESSSTTSQTKINRIAAGSALVFGVLGVAWRLIMMINDTPPGNSDEATIGLAALHIAQGRDFPIWFYGQHYMGTMDAYLAAPLFKILGPSTFLQRVPTLALFAVFLLLMYRLSLILFSPTVAVATVGFLAFGADRLVKNELISAGGYPEINTLLAGLLLIGVGLAKGAYRRPAMAISAWGVLFGLIVWTHWLAAPYLLAAAVALVVASRPRPNLRMGALAIAGAVVGASPLIVYNLTAPARYNSISTFLTLNSAGGHPGIWDRVFGGVIYGLPMASGLCSAGHCHPYQLWWAPVYLLLLALAAVFAYRDLRRSGEVRPLFSLALVGGAALTILFYAHSPAAAETPTESARYLHYLLITTPAWISALWKLANGVLGRYVRLAGAATAVALVVSASLATVSLARKVPDYQLWARQGAQVVHELRGRGITSVYSDYWTCDRIIFLSAEDVRCGVLTDDLRPGLNRYSAYWDEIQSQGTAQAFLVPASGPVSEPQPALDAAVRALLTESNVAFAVTRLDGYVLYQPEEPVRLPT